MAKDTASEFKESGNNYFKSGRLTEAINCYKKAEKAAPDNAIYPSNLSAALYEAGNYPACVEAIGRSWGRIGPDANPELTPRLSSRLAKALCQGVRDGSISQEFLDTHSETIVEMHLSSLMVQDGSGTATNVLTPWEDWKLIEEEGKEREKIVEEARVRLASLPIFRKASVVFREYYTIGQDRLMSILDDWGPDNKDQSPLRIKDMTKQELSNLAFLFGGVGDARHVYGSIAGMSRTHAKLPRSKLKAFRVHMTLLDVHPGALLRDLCVFMLVNDLIEMTGNDPIAKAEILSTILYTFFGVVMPDYCHRRLHEKIKDFKMRLSQTPPDFPDWIHIDKGAIVPMLDVLDYWSNVDRKFNTTTLLNGYELDASDANDILSLLDNPHISPDYRKAIQASLDNKRKNVAATLDNYTDQQRRELGLITPTARSTKQDREVYAKKREAVIDMMLKLLSTGTGPMSDEKDWYHQAKVFLPPTNLWSRHPGFEISRASKDPKGGNLVNWKPINAHIRSSWKPNATLFDRARGIYPSLKPNPFETPLFIEEFNKRLGFGAVVGRGDTVDTPAYNAISNLFTTVASVIKALPGQIKLEFLCGELTHELAKMKLGADKTRPAEFPRVYNRAYSSNCPDYTHGILNTIVFALPAVKPDAAVGANCLLNSGIWKTDEEHAYTYTLLRPQDLDRYLGCRLISNEAMHHMIIVGNRELPRPLHELAARGELLAWLSRVLIYTLIPGTGGQTAFRARLPNNLSAFIHLLIHLRTVGYPAHWLGDFLQTIVSGTFITDVVPYLGKWPIPVSDINNRTTSRAVRLDPWKLELEAILATAYQALPFSVSIPRDYTRLHEDIAIFEATAQASNSLMGSMYSPVLIADPGACILLYKPSKGITAQTLVTAIPDIFNGAIIPLPGSFYLLTAQEEVDLPRVRWRLSVNRVKVMKDENWSMVVFRTDNRQPFTHPVSASQWKEVQRYTPIMDSEA